MQKQIAIDKNNYRVLKQLCSKLDEDKADYLKLFKMLDARLKALEKK